VHICVLECSQSAPRIETFNAIDVAAEAVAAAAAADEDVAAVYVAAGSLLSVARNSFKNEGKSGTENTIPFYQ